MSKRLGQARVSVTYDMYTHPTTLSNAKLLTRSADFIASAAETS